MTAPTVLCYWMVELRLFVSSCDDQHEATEMLPESLNALEATELMSCCGTTTVHR